MWGFMRVFDAQHKLRIKGPLANPTSPEVLNLQRWAAVTQQILNLGRIPDAVIHYGRLNSNAVYQNGRLLFGPGDNLVFKDFTSACDIFAHEVTHHLIESSPRWNSKNQTGALAEHVADVFGVCVRRSLTNDSSWRIGADLFLDGHSALRDMLHPGTAFDIPGIGSDPQPGHMAQYVHDEVDRGGVHVNSGIPNRAFALFADEVDTCAHQEPLRIWRAALRRSGRGVRFEGFARIVCAEAGQYRAAARWAWGEVGITV